MIGDPHEPRCDWLQQARLEFRSNAITVHGETFVKMAAVEEIINRLSEERQRYYKAHSKRSICNCEPKAKGNDTDPKMCKVCLPEAYMREGCSCLDMHDAVIARAAREDERKSQTNKCHTCRTLQWDNRLIWSLESLLTWVRANHMDQIDIRDHIDLMLGEYRNELEVRQQENTAPSELAVDSIIADISQRSCLGRCWEKIDLETRSGIREMWRVKISQQIGAVAFATKQEKYSAIARAAIQEVFKKKIEEYEKEHPEVVRV